jgi:SAM-dependent methyltransferase
MSTTGRLTEHYRHGGLEQALLDGLRAAGKDPDHLRPEDMMGSDEFHIGGVAATRELAGQMELAPGMTVLDIGSGVGGPARQMAGMGCVVTGVDLSAEYVGVATALSRRMGLAAAVSFRQGDAAVMDLAPGSFDRATLLHVGMNIADKPALFAAVYRALKPGGIFAVYDVMRLGPGDIAYPVPWSSTAETSFVETPAVYRAALGKAGFTVFAERARGEVARGFFAQLRATQAQAGGPPPLGLHLVLGPTGRTKSANMQAMVESGLIAPVEMLGRK